jgi:hypothetical protein
LSFSFHCFFTFFTIRYKQRGVEANALPRRIQSGAAIEILGIDYMFQKNMLLFLEDRENEYDEFYSPRSAN